MGHPFPLVAAAKEELKGYKVPNLIDTASGFVQGPGGVVVKVKPKEDIVECDEADGFISYHKDKANCAMYYMCEGKRRHHMPCPQNLVFNPNENVS